MTIQEVIVKNLNLFNEQLKQTLDKKNITDTGNAKKSIEIENNSNANTYIFSSIGADYIEILNSGRRSGKRPPIAVLEKWVQSKLGISNAQQRKQVAFAVANKIAKEGTNIFKNPSQGLEVEKLVFELNNRLANDLPKAAKFEFDLKLDEFTKKFAREKLFK